MVSAGTLSRRARAARAPPSPGRARRTPGVVPIPPGTGRCRGPRAGATRCSIRPVASRRRQERPPRRPPQSTPGRTEFGRADWGSGEGHQREQCEGARSQQPAGHAIDAPTGGAGHGIVKSRHEARAILPAFLTGRAVIHRLPDVLAVTLLVPVLFLMAIVVFYGCLLAVLTHRLGLQALGRRRKIETPSSRPACRPLTTARPPCRGIPESCGSSSWSPARIRTATRSCVGSSGATGTPT